MNAQKRLDTLVHNVKEVADQCLTLARVEDLHVAERRTWTTVGKLLNKYAKEAEVMK